MSPGRGGTGNTSRKIRSGETPEKIFAPLFPESRKNPWIREPEVGHGYLVVEKSLEIPGAGLGQFKVCGNIIDGETWEDIRYLETGPSPAWS